MNNTKTKVCLAAAMAVALGLGACGTADDGADEYRQAIPQRQTVEVAVPERSQGPTSMALGTERQGATSGYYELTRTVSRNINGGMLGVLALVRAVVRHPPTELTENTAVWGPHTPALEPITWKVTVTRLSTGNYAYKFEGRPKQDAAAAFETVLHGTHQAAGFGADGLPVEGFGAGSFVLDFEARNRLPQPEKDVGLVKMTYSRPTPGSAVAISASYARVRDEETPGRRVDVEYQYNLRPAGDGDLQFSYKPDPTAVLQGPAMLSVNSRWTSAGAGRADVRAKGGSLPADVAATASECWDTNFNSAFFAPSWAPASGYGTESVCAYPTAVYSLLPL